MERHRRRARFSADRRAILYGYMREGRVGADMLLEAWARAATERCQHIFA
jgi:hypothetical protein